MIIWKDLIHNLRVDKLEKDVSVLGIETLLNLKKKYLLEIDKHFWKQYRYFPKGLLAHRVQKTRVLNEYIN